METDFLILAIFKGDDSVHDEYVRYTRQHYPTVDVALAWAEEREARGAKIVYGSFPSSLTDTQAKIYVSARSLLEMMI